MVRAGDGREADVLGLALEHRPLSGAFPVIPIPPSFESAPDLLKHQRQERTGGARAPSQCAISTLPYQENESDEGANFYCWRASKGLLPGDEDTKRPWEFAGWRLSLLLGQTPRLWCTGNIASARLYGTGQHSSQEEARGKLKRAVQLARYHRHPIPTSVSFCISGWPISTEVPSLKMSLACVKLTKNDPISEELFRWKGQETVELHALHKGAGMLTTPRPCCWHPCFTSGVLPDSPSAR